MATEAELEQLRIEERRRDAWLDEQLTDCRALFDLTLTPEEQDEIAHDLAFDLDGRTRSAAALAQREAVRQLGRVEWADIEGRVVVAQVEAWRIIEDAADRCAPADAGENAERKLRFYLHALAVRAELEGHDLNDVVSDAVFYVLAGDRAASEVWRRLDEQDGDIGLWVAVLLTVRDHVDAGADLDAAQTLRRLRKVAWTYLREWMRNDPGRSVHRHALERALDSERWREALAQTRGRTLAEALTGSLTGDCSGPHVSPVKDIPGRRAAAEGDLWTLKVTTGGRWRTGAGSRAGRE